jgi:hypothetical protein
MLYVKYIQNIGVRRVFLSVLPHNIATADGYSDAIQEELEKCRLSHRLSSCKLTGTGTDGAASMT